MAAVLVPRVVWVDPRAVFVPVYFSMVPWLPSPLIIIISGFFSSSLINWLVSMVHPPIVFIWRFRACIGGLKGLTISTYKVPSNGVKLFWAGCRPCQIAYISILDISPNMWLVLPSLTCPRTCLPFLPLPSDSCMFSLACFLIWFLLLVHAGADSALAFHRLDGETVGKTGQIRGASLAYESPIMQTLQRFPGWYPPPYL